jgi:hypothetical protein
VVTLVLPDQVRSTSSVIRKAGVEAVHTRVSAGGADLVRVTGARRPSGLAVAAPIGESGSGSDARGGSGKRTRKDGTAGDRSARGNKNKAGSRDGSARGKASASRDRTDRTDRNDRSARPPRDGSARDGSPRDRVGKKSAAARQGGAYPRSRHVHDRHVAGRP